MLVSTIAAIHVMFSYVSLPVAAMSLTLNLLYRGHEMRNMVCLIIITSISRHLIHTHHSWEDQIENDRIDLFLVVHTSHTCMYASQTWNVNGFLFLRLTRLNSLSRARSRTFCCRCSPCTYTWVVWLSHTHTRCHVLPYIHPQTCKYCLRHKGFIVQRVIVLWEPE